jgi:hypothetical protein
MQGQVAVAPRPRRASGALTSALSRERWVDGRVGLAWSLLVLNVLTFVPGQSVLLIPSAIGKAITQGALPLAIVVALSVNRKIIVRPNVFLCLVSLLVIEAIITALQAQYLHSTGYRTFRLAEFVFALWLLSPFWGRRDLLLVRWHLKAMLVVLGSVVLGVLGPNHGMYGGRLSGALWPIPPTQVAHYAAVTIGLFVVLWLCGLRSGKATLVVFAVVGIILVLTRTRTALVGLTAGVLVAGLSLIVAKARVRRMFAAVAAVVTVVIVTLSSYITTFLLRGEDQQQLTGLSGRTGFWGPLLAFPRTRFQEIFGFGLSNDSFGGLPIDSNWFASYSDQGLFGVAVCAAMVVFLFVTAYFQPRGVQRALALFLITYCLIASFTEVGFTSASTYLLDLTLAASMLVPFSTGGRPASE